jgi:hypothetical protein
MEATALLDRKIPARQVYDRQAIMASDASDFAVASYSIEGLPELSFSEELTLEERGESSSTRELLAIQRTLQHWEGSDTIARPFFSRRSAIFHTDLAEYLLSVSSPTPSQASRCGLPSLATANFLTHFIISIAVLENVPPDAGLQKNATFPH